MQKFEFELILANELSDSELDQAYEAGFDDSTFAVIEADFGDSTSGVIDNIPTAFITREAKTFVDAVIGAINQLEKATTVRVINVVNAEAVFEKSPNIKHKHIFAAINAQLDARHELSYLPPQVTEIIKALVA